jgi:hypothetical protein
VAGAPRFMASANFDHMGLSELGYTTNSHSNRENDDSPTDLGVPYFQTNSFFSLGAKKISSHIYLVLSGFQGRPTFADSVQLFFQKQFY